MKLFVNVQQTIMSVWSAVIFVLLGAVIHGSFALKCYKCATETGLECDDPLQTEKEEKVTVDVCSQESAVCAYEIKERTGMQISYVAKR